MSNSIEEGRRKRLLVLCHGYPPYYGGAEHVAAHLAREAAREHDVCVLTSDIGGRLKGREYLEGVEIRRLPARKKAWTRHTSLELCSFYRVARSRLADWVGELKPDYILAHFAFPAGALARAARRRFGIPYAVVVHGSDVPGYQPKRFALMYPLYRPVFRGVCDAADRVISVSADLAALAGAAWPGAISVVHNGVDVGRFHPDETRSDTDGPLRVMVTAQLIERKGIDFLIEGVAGMPAEVRDRLVIDVFGEGPHRRALENHIRRRGLAARFVLRGLLEAGRMPEALRSADVYVLPSLQEGLPLSLLEAMASGLPVISTRVGGIPAVLKDRENALLVEPADAGALGAALTEMAQQPALRAQLAGAARHTAETLAWPDVWKRYEQVLWDGPAGRGDLSTRA